MQVRFRHVDIVEQGTPASMSKDFGSTDRRALGVHAVLTIYASETVTPAKNISIYWPVNLIWLSKAGWFCPAPAQGLEATVI